MIESKTRMLQLASVQAEHGLNPELAEELNALLSRHPQLIDVYADYLCLHAQLSWDTGRTSPVLTRESPVAVEQTTAPAQRAVWRRPQRILAAAALTLSLCVVTWMVTPFFSQRPDNTVAGNGSPQTEQPPVSPVPRPPAVHDDNREINVPPLHLRDQDVAVNAQAADDPPVVVESEQNGVRPNTARSRLLPAEFSDADVAEQIFAHVRQGWDENSVVPSERSSDAEFVRRSYLVFAGRIPTLDETTAFLQSTSPRKRWQLTDELLDSKQTAEHLATIWTNLMVGRTARRGVNRERLFDFMYDSFADNKPWIDTVSELITATGRNDENGATNFLLAHLNNQATPATAVTARLFLGEQISCVQCHDHPFSKGVRQEDYWALNAFFKDTVRVVVKEPKQKKSRYLTCRLEDRMQVERITHFETLSGQVRAVLPAYNDVTLDANSPTNRRQVLARLLKNDSSARIARAMVNRMWAHFHGFGFTNPVDDMGPHAAVSHPELLDLLTEAFVRSDYDLKRLMRWIAISEPWQLSSVAVSADDAPESGTTPLFTRVYARRMSPEQVYEAVRVAIRSSSGQPLEHTVESLEHRREWVAQFAEYLQTDENDEAVYFEGTITQALAMMNGLEVEQAIRQATRAMLADAPLKNAENILLQKIARSVLSRDPTPAEKRAFKARIRQLAPQHRNAVAIAVEDMIWAYLNSSEFMLIH